MTELAGRLERVRERIARSARARAPRSGRDHLLLAVTKIFPAEAIREAYDLGLREFGENYVQEFEGKAPKVGGSGGRAFPSDRAPAIQQVGEGGGIVPGDPDGRFGEARAPPERRRDSPLDVMIEVKLSAEEAKSGAEPARAARADRGGARLPEPAPAAG